MLPAFKDMTSEQKFEFIHDWLMNVSGRLEEHGRLINGLHQRLEKAEAASGTQTS
jgi:hypothetical protein